MLGGGGGRGGERKKEKKAAGRAEGEEKIQGSRSTVEDDVCVTRGPEGAPDSGSS